MLHISEGTIRIFTFKTGVLSRAAHDLRFTLRRFELEIHEDSVHGRFWPETLEVDGVMHGDTLDAGSLGPSQREEIVANVRGKILLTERYPEIVLEAHASSISGGHRLDGELELVGKRRTVTFSVSEREGRATGEVELQPTRWGIQPFKALLGAIRLEDRVVLRFDIPLPNPEARFT